MMKNRIVGLDLLRIFAAFGIMMYHFFFIGPLQGFYSMDIFIEGAFWGEFGVDIFFMLSGYSIFYSIKNRDRKDFILSRIKRIYPVFVLCATFTLLCGFIMPGTSAKDLLFRYVFSFTFVQDFVDIAPLSSVYWTLMIEVKFYILICLFAWTKLWKKNYHYFVLTWLLISFFNTFFMQNPFLEKLLLTKYAGHFAVGMIIFSLNSGKSSKINVIEFVLSGILIWNNCASYSAWILSLYDTGMSEFRVFMLVLVIMAAFYTFTNIKEIGLLGGYLSKYITHISASTYIFYLIHADLGYFCRTQWYARVLPLLLKMKIVSEKFVTDEVVLMLGGIVIVLGITAVINRTLCHYVYSK